MVNKSIKQWSHGWFPPTPDLLPVILVSAAALLYFRYIELNKMIRNSETEKSVCFRTFSRSGSLRASASSLLSITEAAATSNGVEPRIDGDAAEETYELHRMVHIYTHKHTVMYITQEQTERVSFSGLEILDQGGVEWSGVEILWGLISQK